ncbi:hypothetical protein pdam_00012209 [Pocillopora damicornis]|uniref:Pentraxin (PTX) domain-containing protein n=2 Tax=Pocillopora damicornis TaxID=46731 RepID=A0A3M6UGI7_POCDA|nr:hypothetical protein pdam_00012209 [Pocillopora damicornis]
MFTIFTSTCGEVYCLSTEIFEIVSYHRDFYSTPLNNGIWHSICITWKRSTRICTAYIDGKTNKRRTFTSCRGDTEFEFGQPLVLGQLVKSKGRFQEGNSFTGNINGVNMWDYAMEENEVYNLATNCSSRVGNVVSWPLFRNVLEGNVVLTEGSICSGPDLSSKVSLKFPAMTAVDRIKYSGSLPSFQAFTLCQWTKLVFIQADATSLSYANSESPNALVLLLKKDLTIRIFINNKRLQAFRAPFLDKHWHHACVTWTNNGGEFKFYIDGSLMRVVTGYGNGDVIRGGGILIFGQEQDNLGGSFDAKQSLVGFLSHLNLWNFVVHSFALVDIATGSGTENGNTVAWKDVIRGQAYGQVEVVSISQDPPKRPNMDFKYVFASQTNPSYVQLYDATTDETIVKFTACVWVSVYQSETMTLFTYRTSEMRNAIGMRPRSSDPKSFTIIVNNKFLNVDYDDFFEETGWQHICVTWENGAGNWKLYVNGESVKSGSGLQPGVEIKGKGELLLGQRYRTGSDTIKQEHGLVGEISHLNIWNRTLSTTILLAMYRGCDSTGGNFFDWSSLLSGQVVGQVTRETSAECTFPDEVISSKRNLFCEGMTKDGCSSPLYALFDGTKDSRAKKWRCYFSNALTQDNSGLLAYDYKKESSCYITIANPDFYLIT